MSESLAGPPPPVVSSPVSRPAVDAVRPDPLVESVARLLAVGTVVVVLTVAAGTALVLLAGAAPVAEPGPALDPGRLPLDLAALRGDGVLWLGLLLSVGLPTARGALALAGFARRGERRLVAVSASTLAVLGLSVTLALLSR
jgi:uncharacterized membrane protein